MLLCECVCVRVCVCERERERESVCSLSTVTAFLIRGLIRSSATGSVNKPSEALQTRPVYCSSL